MTAHHRYPLAVVALAGLVLLGARARKNPMQPLPSERLSKPLVLGCGLTIHEWRGGPIQRGRVGRWCAAAVHHYPAFVRRQKLRRKHRRPFRFQAALMPDGSCHRCMNDLQDRFRYRPQQIRLVGYTSKTQGWLYLIGNAEHPEFDVTFVHELFHALNIFYGLWTPGEREERLARRFTAELGLGE